MLNIGIIGIGDMGTVQVNGIAGAFTNGLDDKLESFHYYMMMIKFGMGRATWDAAQEVRDNKITREEGVTLVNKYDTDARSNAMDFYDMTPEYESLMKSCWSQDKNQRPSFHTITHKLERIRTQHSRQP
jgi:hypothetical protein